MEKSRCNETPPRMNRLPIRWMLTAALLTLAAAASGSPSAQQRADRIQRVDVERTSLQIHFASGRVLRGRELAGATLSLDLPGAEGPQRVRIGEVVSDPMDPAGEVLLYRMTVLNPDTGAEEELCDADPQGEHWTFPLQGTWDAQGRRLSRQHFTLTCSSGAQGKCLRFGYKPWKTAANGARLEDYHQACIRMVTANYCGDHGTTRDGMLIDLYDSLGIQQRSEPADGDDLRFEAAWGTQGALCVAHTRVPANITVQQLAEVCPRLQGHLGEEACNEDSARSGTLGRALLFNRSR
jgi:hypothetical protein